jgi:NADPH-dependent 2,4-dienoyl-CoA reductase/sulfur reductase-like enzyme/Fe-S-cluster-containing hydrogenase component 2
MISSALFANGIHIFGHHPKDSSPQGIFCANGQCAQCLVIANGLPVKSCITPVTKNMDVRSMDGYPILPDDDKIIKKFQKIKHVKTPILIIGGGPAGMSAALEFGNMGLKCTIVDDKNELGGKLNLQTHNFFGSIRDCYAGKRGMDIGNNLSSLVKENRNIDVWNNSTVVGVFVDGFIGIIKKDNYMLVKPKRILVTAGAREKTIAFPGCDLPGIYGAGAFQTLVNRDLIKPTEKLFIVGGGNVGLIGAYHALQAGIDVIGIVEALPYCGGYKVHLDKIKRLGIPIFTSHTVIRAEGKNHLERVIISKINDKFQPVKGTEIVFKADTMLIAVGLTPLNEVTKKAEEFGIKTYSAGDANIIAEASAAMFSGRITARKMLIDMGYDVDIPNEWNEMVEILRKKPGEIITSRPLIKNKDVYPVIHCVQEIPCNPCTESCIKQSIKISESTMMGIPNFNGDCLGCTKCVSICPGLAITLVDKRYDESKKKARVVIPWEMPKKSVKNGQLVTTTDMEGNILSKGTIIAIKNARWQNQRTLLSLEVPYDKTDNIAGIKIKNYSSGKSLNDGKKLENDEIIICRCERVSKNDIVNYIKKTGTRDFNAIKAALRVGMGACGGKTCEELIMGIFKELGIDVNKVNSHINRPFSQEVPIKAFIGSCDD